MFDAIRRFFLKVLSIFVVFSADINSGQSIDTPSNDLTECKILNLYGFNTKEEIQAIEYILKGANIIDPNSSVQEYLRYSSDNKQNAQNIYRFVKDSQEKLSLRSGHEKRWDVKYKKIQWGDGVTKDGILKALKNLGLIDQKLELNFLDYDALAILGATGGTIRKRVRFADNYVKDDVKIFLLTGQRDCDPKIEKEFIDKFKEKYNLDAESIVYETDIFKEIIEESDKMKNKEKIVIDTKKSPEGSIPNTYTTALDLFKNVKEYGIKKIVFISNQPYVNYQKSSIDSAFFRACKDGYISKGDLQYTVVGNGVEEERLIDIDTMCKELGSFIFGKTPTVLSECNIQKQDIGEDFAKFAKDSGHHFQKVLPEIFAR